jgi:protocatechuate 3,4-dioxygenase alpha subunit
MANATASQTAGPFWHMIDFPEWADLLRADGPNAGAAGDRIILTGRITDGDGAVVPDAMVEIWQAGADGRYDSGFHGFGRCATDADGVYRFVTLKPGAVAGPGNSTQAPHITIAIFARGLMAGVTTRAYFAGDALLADDPVLALVQQARRSTLIAREQDEAGIWRLDIRLQGEGETVFLAV